MQVVIPREVHPKERRVAATPQTVQRLIEHGFQVAVESGAGAGASFTDNAYAAAGAEIVSNPESLWKRAGIVLKVRAPALHPGANCHEADWLQPGATLISFIWPAQNQALLELLAARKVTVLAMDQVPRVTRAQKLDALSSMANIAGYRAVIEAANLFGRFFTGQVTAAGKVPPAKVLVIGAGVAGLAAVGAAQSLGAIVRAFDTRPAVREQVQSMGAEFLEVQLKEDGSGQGGYAKEMSPEFIAAEMALFKEQAREVDIIITTALIPGKPAPKLITREIVETLKPGSVIVDLAAETGGNCELTVADQVREHAGVQIVGFTDLASRLAPTASQLYGTNLCHFLDDLGRASGFHIDVEDEVVRGALVLLEGKLMWPPPRKAAPAPAAQAPAVQAPQAAAPAAAPPKPKAGGHGGHGGHSVGRPVAPRSPWQSALLLLCACLIAGLGWFAPAGFLSHLTVFVLACFVGWQVVWNVTPALHTPLMSVTNAISGIILIGGMLKLSGPLDSLVTWLGICAVLVALINVVGGFLVTQRMLSMFRK
jgi:H+-translocating NAD(P) transhydrogenase subunit alpha